MSGKEKNTWSVSHKSMVLLKSAESEIVELLLDPGSAEIRLSMGLFSRWTDGQSS